MQSLNLRKTHFTYSLDYAKTALEVEELKKTLAHIKIKQEKAKKLKVDRIVIKITSKTQNFLSQQNKYPLLIPSKTLKNQIYTKKMKQRLGFL